MSEKERRPWRHAPAHRLIEQGVFMVTSGTYAKQHAFGDRARLRLLRDALLDVARDSDWELHAWAVFSNHYHFVAASPPNPDSLSKMIAKLHARTAILVDRMDEAPGRKVWHNYWDTALTSERSYLARLNYVHQNPVRHVLVKVATEYPYCSANAFRLLSPSAFVNTVFSFPIDRVKVFDEFEPVLHASDYESAD